MLRGDNCSISLEKKANEKALKYRVTNFSDMLPTNFNHLMLGSDKSQGLPSKLVEKNSEMNMRAGDCKERNQTLPYATTPGFYNVFHGDIDVESNFGNIVDSRKKCGRSSVPFYTKSFYIFDENPNPLDSVDKNLRHGSPTRVLQPQSYSKIDRGYDISKVSANIQECNTTDQSCHLDKFKIYRF